MASPPGSPRAAGIGRRPPTPRPWPHRRVRRPATPRRFRRSSENPWRTSVPRLWPRPASCPSRASSSRRPGRLGFQQVGGGIGPPGALGEAGLAVVGEPPVGPGYCRVDFVIGRRSECLDCFAGSRVDGGDGHADILCWVGLHKSSGVQPATNVASAPEQEVSGPPIGWGGLYHGQDQRGGTCHRSHVRRELIGPFNRPVARRLCVATSAGRSARSACGATRLGPVAARPRW